MSRWLNATMTKVEYASLCSKETKTVQYGGIEVKGKYKVRKRNDDEFQEVHAAIAVTTFLSYYIMIIIGHIRDFLRKILKRDKSAVKDVSSSQASLKGSIGGGVCTWVCVCVLQVDLVIAHRSYPKYILSVVIARVHSIK